MSKKKQKIGKVNPILYAGVYAALKHSYTKKYNITFDKAAVRDIKGPAIVVATHTSDADHILSALTLYPVRPTYIVSEHFIRFKSTARLLKLMHVITKKMFTPDVSTIRKILRAKGENAVFVIFAEGRLSCYGKTLPIADGTAELVKKLGIDLYSWKAEGAYLTFPKWRNEGDNRPGKINSSVKLLLSKDELAERSVSDINTVIEEAIFNDDEVAMKGVEYKSDTIAEGAEKILFKCPSCLEEHTLVTEGAHIRCKCGLDVTLDNYYKLHGAPFGSINEWFEWQQNSIDPDTDFIFTKARFGTPGDDGFMDTEAGKGEVYIDGKEFRLKGVIHGEAIEFTVSTDKIGAFPISPGDHIDIYHEGKLIYIYPENMNSSVKWVCFLDRFNEVRALSTANSTR